MGFEMDSTQKEKLVHLLSEAFGISLGKWDDIYVKDVAVHLLDNGIAFPVPCSECTNNGCCSIQEAMGESGYCSKGKPKAD